MLRNILVFITFLTLSNADQCNVRGECIDSDLLQITHANDYLECLKACQESSDCNWYSYRKSQKYCVLYNTCSEISAEYCNDCVSGESTCPYYECNISGLCLVRNFRIQLMDCVVILKIL